MLQLLLKHGLTIFFDLVRGCNVSYQITSLHSLTPKAGKFSGLENFSSSMVTFSLLWGFETISLRVFVKTPEIGSSVVSKVDKSFDMILENLCLLCSESDVFSPDLTTELRTGADAAFQKS